MTLTRTCPDWCSAEHLIDDFSVLHSSADATVTVVEEDRHSVEIKLWVSRIDDDGVPGPATVGLEIEGMFNGIVSLAPADVHALVSELMTHLLLVEGGEAK